MTKKAEGVLSRELIESVVLECYAAAVLMLAKLLRRDHTTIVSVDLHVTIASDKDLQTVKTLPASLSCLRLLILCIIVLVRLSTSQCFASSCLVLSAIRMPFAALAWAAGRRF